jgi:hypothetical protein
LHGWCYVTRRRTPEVVEALAPLLLERGLVHVADFLGLAADTSPASGGFWAEFDFLERILDWIDALIRKQRGV